MDAGWIELIMGNMFSGKTTELIKKVGRYKASGREAQIIKPRIDDRYDVDHVVSHDKAQSNADYVDGLEGLMTVLRRETQVVGIDEAQFFEEGIVNYCEMLANNGRIVVVAALSRDYRGRPFPFLNSTRTVYDLAAIADHTKILTSICTFEDDAGRKCGQEASWVQRYRNGELAPPDAETVKVGGSETVSKDTGEVIDYRPRCRSHFQWYD